MGLITLDLPVIGQQNTTEDPKIRNDFSLLQNLVNGNIDGANLSPGLLAQMGQVQNVLSNAPIRTVGESGNQVAGRVLAATDFTNMGLNLPLGLWNLSNVNDSSGSGRNLVNKGAVTFASGITGSASEAAQFTGSTGQALYIADTGAADPFRIRTGSWGCWFRTAKRGTACYLLGKHAASPQFSWALSVTTANVVSAEVSSNGSAIGTQAGVSDIADDRWHHAVVTLDGTTVRVYVDGALEGRGNLGYFAFAGSGPLNIGAFAADGSTAAGSPHYGRVDEAFVTGDVLSEEQIRNLYCLSIAHTLGTPPSDVRLNIRRKRRGAALAITDFPSTPVRLYNFTGGALTSPGTTDPTAVAPVGGGSIVDVAGADGSLNSAKSFSGAHTGLGSTDANLPSGLSARSLGLWMKCSVTGSMCIFSMGTTSTGEARIDSFGASANTLRFISNADVINPAINVYDGLWHHFVEVDDNTASDGVKRKVYYDGRIVGGSTVLNSITLAGANKFRLGAINDSTNPFTGQIDGVFVYAAALTAEQVRTLYNVGTPAMAASPKDSTDHVEAFEATRILGVFDTLEGSDSMDLVVVA